MKQQAEGRAAARLTTIEEEALDQYTLKSSGKASKLDNKSILTGTALLIIRNVKHTHTLKYFTVTYRFISQEESLCRFLKMKLYEVCSKSI